MAEMEELQSYYDRQIKYTKEQLEDNLDQKMKFETQLKKTKVQQELLLTT